MMKKLFRSMSVALLVLSGTWSTAQAEELPYSITFANDNYSTWTSVDDGVEDANWHNCIWQWYNSSWWYSMTSKQSTEANDWLLSPQFTLSSGTQYEITYKIDRDTGDNLDITVAVVTDAATPVSVQQIDEWDFATDKGKEKTVSFVSSTDGAAYIGLQVTGTYAQNGSSAGKIKFRSFSMKALAKASAPAPVTDVTVTPGANGANAATISFKAPTTDVEGKPLTGDVTVNVYREDQTTPAGTTTVAPGATGSVTDANALAGETYYIVRAAIDNNESAEVRADAWIGTDIPVAVTNLAVTVSGGKPALTWTASAAGVHGGYIDQSALTYKISRVADGKLTSAGTANTTTFSDANLDVSKQANVAYQVIAQSAAGLGEAVQSGAVNVGPQLALPFAESFANAAYSTSPWLNEVVKNFDDANYQPEWTLIESATVTDNVTDDNPEGDEVTIASQDTDKGMLRFNSNAVGKMKDAAIGRLVFPAIDFSAMQNPVLTFYMFRESYYTTDPATNGGYRNDFVEVAVKSDNGEYVTLPDAKFYRYGRDNAWVACEVPLYQMAGKQRVQVALVGNGFGGGPMYIDNVKITERTAHDLQAVSLAGPSRLRVGETGHFNLAVKNAGGFASDAFSVELLKDGARVATAQGSTIQPGRIATIDLEYTPANGQESDKAAVFAANIVYAKDQDLTNNLSLAVNTAITAALLPAVNDLAGTVDGSKVTLSWSKAAYLPASTLVEEDGFESYEPFVINSFGDFTTYDLDNRITAGIGAAAGVSYPNSGEKIAFQVFAPTLTNMDPEEYDLWAPHTGVNMAIAPQAMTASGYTASNDWLVFPALSGYEQTIKFWARSVSTTYSEFVQGFYATTANPSDADDFLPCPDGGDISYAVPAEWTELSYSVPRGAKYFALRHVSADGYVLMVDDVTYQRSIPDATAAGLQGYNVYCDGVKVNDTPVAGPTYDYTATKGGAQTYTVTAVYPAGESTVSNAVELTVAGISEIGAAGASVTIDGNEVVIKASADTGVRLYTPAGSLVGAGTGNCRLTAPGAGVYLLAVGTQVRKILIQ